MFRKTHTSAYAIAIFDLVLEDDRFVELEPYFELLKEFLNQNPEFIDYLKNDGIPETERLETIDLAFVGFDWIFINSLKVIVQRKAVNILKNIIIEYLKLSNYHLKIRYIDVISAFPLNNEQLQEIKEKLQKTTRRTIKITNHIDKSLISGFKIVSRTEVLELNYKRELQKLKNQIIWNREEV